MRECDALVIGGGFFGCRVALALQAQRVGRVVLVDREATIMRRASFVNQARVHNGYHYPRSLATAIASQRNFQRFVEEHAFAVLTNVKMVYGIARNSAVTASQFSRFCEEIGAPCREERHGLGGMFDTALVEACFRVREIAFDCSALARDLTQRLGDAGVNCCFRVSARVIRWNENWVFLDTTQGPLRARYVFNCTYAYLDDVGLEIRHRIKKELSEIALIAPPQQMRSMAVTIVDGPFFSSMPFPTLGCYSLTHVRYTPHASWTSPGDSANDFCGTRANSMIRDAMRYMPCMKYASYLGSLYELKAVLMNAENSDARPIVFERAANTKRIYSILGSKFDNVYDILAIIGREKWVVG